MKHKLIALVALALPCSAQAQQMTAEELTAIDTAVSETLKETAVPSASIAVVRGGQLVLSRAWGKPSETITEPDPDLPYQIASNSKQFLAALLLMLENEGKLDLDDKVVKWLPELPHADRYSVRQLLNHTSGLQDFWPQDYMFAAMEHAAAPMDIVRRWGFKPLDYEPGTRWQYSNTGYVVAGIIAEKAGGQPLWQLLEATDLRPAGDPPLPDRRDQRSGLSAGLSSLCAWPCAARETARTRLAVGGGRAFDDRGGTGRMEHRTDRAQLAPARGLGRDGTPSAAGRRHQQRLWPGRIDPDRLAAAGWSITAANRSGSCRKTASGSKTGWRSWC